MKPIKIISRQLETIRGYDRSLKLFLTIPVLFGLYFAVKWLFFNFYILALGYDKAYLGIANSMTPAATLILAFPLGILTDRIGRKRSVLVGMLVLAFSYLVFLFTTNSTMILVTLFVSGIGETLYFVSATPLLTRLTTKENRVAVFSMRAALFTFSGVIGSYIGGQMPLWIDTLLAMPPGTVESYRGVLLTSFVILLLTLIPVWLIPPGDGSRPRDVPAEVPVEGKSQTPPAIQENGSGSIQSIVKNMHNILRKKVVWQLFIPNLLIGLGAALMVPYLNLFLVETFHISDQLLGTLFSIGALVTGFGTLFSPWLARRLGTRIRALVLAQASSLVFLLILGFSPILGLAVIGFWGRNALMNKRPDEYGPAIVQRLLYGAGG
jgi:MFS family permease